MSFEQRYGYPGKESFITVNVFNDDADKYPVCSATLKLIQLEQDGSGGDTVSSFFSIEYIDPYSESEKRSARIYSEFSIRKH